MGLVDQEEKNSDSSTPSETDAFPAEMKEKSNLDTPKKLIVTGETNFPSVLAEKTHDANGTTARKADKVCARSDKEAISEPNSPSILASNFDSVAMDDVQFNSKADQSLEDQRSTVNVSFHLKNDRIGDNEECILKCGANGKFRE